MSNDYSEKVEEYAGQIARNMINGRSSETADIFNVVRGADEISEYRVGERASQIVMALEIPEGTIYNGIEQLEDYGFQPRDSKKTADALQDSNVFEIVSSIWGTTDYLREPGEELYTRLRLEVGIPSKNEPKDTYFSIEGRIFPNLDSEYLPDSPVSPPTERQKEAVEGIYSTVSMFEPVGPRDLELNAVKLNDRVKIGKLSINPENIGQSEELVREYLEQIDAVVEFASNVENL